MDEKDVIRRAMREAVFVVDCNVIFVLAFEGGGQGRHTVGKAERLYWVSSFKTTGRAANAPQMDLAQSFSLRSFKTRRALPARFL